MLAALMSHGSSTSTPTSYLLAALMPQGSRQQYQHTYTNTCRRRLAAAHACCPLLLGCWAVGLLGCWAVGLQAFEELMEQGLADRFDDVVLAVGSGGTACGLAVANYLAGASRVPV